MNMMKGLDQEPWGVNGVSLRDVYSLVNSVYELYLVFDL